MSNESTEPVIREFLAPDTAPVKKRIQKRTLSIASKIFGGLFVLTGFILKACGLLVNVSIDDIIKVGIFFVVLLAVVDVSVWIERFRGGA